MKEFPKYAILVLAGFALGFSAQALMGVGLRKARNKVFLAESAGVLEALRGKIADFRKARGRWPKGPSELGLDPANPPMESLRRGARWVETYDGQGGFVYAPASGELTLNVDLSREKFTQDDWKRLKQGSLLPKGALY